jgi:hypothetical protein
MADLTHRAEQALLGALLRDPDQIGNVRFLTAADFATPRHRAVFTAIADVHDGRLNGSLTPADLVVSLAAQQPDLSVQQLGELADSCPHPANAPAYARMVAEASLRRSLAVHAERLVEDATQLNREIGRVPAAAKPGHGADAFPAHLLKLAHAMMRHAWGFDQEPAASAGTPQQARQPGDGQARQEEEVLAGLIRHFPQNSNVVNWLPAEAFTPGPRREVYQAITALARSGEPLEALSVDWQLSRDQAAVRPAGSEPAPPRPEAGYVARLASLPITAGTATLTGRLLLNQHAAAQLRTHPAHTENVHRPGGGPAPATMRGPAVPQPARRPPRLASPPPLIPPPPGNNRQPNQPGPEPRP